MPVKIVISIFTGFIILFVWMMLSTNLYPSNVPASSSNQATSSTPSDQNVIVEVNYAGPWKGAIQDNSGGRSETRIRKSIFFIR